LAGLGYVTRERSDEDRRVVLLSLTEEGRSCLARVRQERLERIASVVGKLETEDLEKLLDVFQKLMFVLEKE
jgi:DNA-binding MarR family transcriptional regulator